MKSKITGEDYSPRRAGQLNEETQYVLDHFQVEAPKLLSDLRVQVKDVELRNIEGIKGSVSIKSAWKSMKELNIKTLPVTRDSKLEGLITIGDIATSYMDVYDSGILSKARTQYRNIASTIDGTIIAGNPHSYVLNGKVGDSCIKPKADVRICGRKMSGDLRRPPGGTAACRRFECELYGGM